MPHILVKKKNGAPAFGELLAVTPVIIAVKSLEGMEKVLTGPGKIVFVLFGDLLNIPEIVGRLKGAGKMVLVHLDLVDGLGPRDAAVDYLAVNTGLDGILSTKANLIKYAKNRGLVTVQRFFVLDSMALVNIEKQLPLDHADAVEILPGLMPKIIRHLAPLVAKPIIAGGLISDPEDVRGALDAGAVAVSSSNAALL